MATSTKENAGGYFKQKKEIKDIIKNSPSITKRPISTLRKIAGQKKNRKLLMQYGTPGANSRAFGTEYKASGGNVASYYGKGGRVAGCGPAQNKR